MRRFARLIVMGIVTSFGAVDRSNASPLTWKLADPSEVVAYQVSGGVFVIASQNLLTCEKNEITAEWTPGTFDYKVGSPGTGILCFASYQAQIAVRYVSGTFSTVTVKTKSKTMTISVVSPP